MIGSINKAKIGTIFQDQSCLHLVIWDRFSDSINIRGLTLMKELIQRFDLVMPILRPIGRKSNGYIVGMKNDFQEPVPNSISVDIPSAPILPGDYSGHCELWIQIAGSINDSVLEFLKSYIDEQSSNFAIFLNHITPDWAPLSPKYAKTRNSLSSEIVREIGKKKLPSLLKLIWYRSSQAISYWVSQNKNDSIIIDPITHKGILHNMMAYILSDINPNEYGIETSFNSIDPSSIEVSHMAAFAINALMPVIHLHQMEQYFGNRRITHPLSYSSREEYLMEFFQIVT